MRPTIKRANRISRRAGFTLVELLVSITLTIFILTLFATLFGAGNDAVRAARGNGELDRSVQGAITKIRRDLEHVYIGEGVKLSQAFASPITVPNAGYFTIEENLPASLPYYISDQTAAGAVTSPTHDPNLQARAVAINTRLRVNAPPGYTGNPQPAVGYRQGIDDRGLPLEIDVDDVLAFTVKLSGENASEIFYGRVPVGSVLDNDLDPGSRFDSPGNGQFTSPMAEVCYFLRADRPVTLTDLNRPGLGTDEGRLPQVPTFTLYRRELLVLSESQRNQVEERLGASVLNDMQQVMSPPPPLSYRNQNPSLIGDLSTNPNFNASVYHQYDLSVRFDPGLGTVRFNDIISLRLRQNRYGMQWLGGPVFPAPDWAVAPTPPAVSRVRNPQFCLPAYDHVALGLTDNPDLSMFFPNAPAGTYPPGVRTIFRGRPTQFESTLVGFQGYAPANNAAYSPDASTNHASWNFFNSGLGFDNPATPGLPTNRRGNADVLLTNIVSFDVKVLNDDVPTGLTAPPMRSDESTAWFIGTDLPADLDAVTLLPVMPEDPLQWPAIRTQALGRINPADLGYNTIPNNLAAYLRVGSLQANPSRLRTAANPQAMIQQDFIDLGYTFVRELPVSFTGIGLPRCVIAESVRQRLPPLVPPPSKAKRVDWGSQTPARWMSLGRVEAWTNSQLASPGTIPGAVYDTWAPEYGADSYATEFLSLTPPRITRYLPPYDRPLRGIQITIRTIEPRTGLVREFQIVQKF